MNSRTRKNRLQRSRALADFVRRYVFIAAEIESRTKPTAMKMRAMIPIVVSTELMAIILSVDITMESSEAVFSAFLPFLSRRGRGVEQKRADCGRYWGDSHRRLPMIALPQLLHSCVISP